MESKPGFVFLRRLLLASLGVIVVLLVATAALAYSLLRADTVRLALEEQGSRWLGQPVRIGAARAALGLRPSIELHDVRVGDPAALTLGAITVALDLRALLSRRVEQADVTVTSSRMALPLPFGLPAAGSGATGSGRGIEIGSVRSIALRDIHITSRGREIALAADLALDGQRLTIRRFSAASGQTQLEADGAATLAPPDATVNVRASRVDVDDLIALAAAFGPAPQEGAGSRGPRAGTRRVPGTLVAHIRAEAATAAGIDIRDFATDLAAGEDAVTLTSVTFELFGGRYDGALRVQLGPVLDVTLRSRVADIDVAQLAAYRGREPSVTGTMTGAGSFRGRGADLAAVLADAAGSGTATIADGTMRRLHLVRTVVDFFGTGPPEDASLPSDAFRNLDVRFSLAGQVVHAEAFRLHSDDADAQGRGTLALPDRTLDGTFDLVLSDELSARAGRTANRLMREGNRIVLPARVSGTLAEPRLRIDAAAAFRRGVRNVRERLGGVRR